MRSTAARASAGEANMTTALFLRTFDETGTMAMAARVARKSLSSRGRLCLAHVTLMHRADTDGAWPVGDIVVAAASWSALSSRLMARRFATRSSDETALGGDSFVLDEGDDLGEAPRPSSWSSSFFSTRGNVRAAVQSLLEWLTTATARWASSDVANMTTADLSRSLARTYVTSTAASAARNASSVPGRRFHEIFTHRAASASSSPTLASAALIVSRRRTRRCCSDDAAPLSSSSRCCSCDCGTAAASSVVGSCERRRRLRDPLLSSSSSIATFRAGGESSSSSSSSAPLSKVAFAGSWGFSTSSKDSASSWCASSGASRARWWSSTTGKRAAASSSSPPLFAMS
mmetsp:Transcript_22453/g.69121  ORF Transcript_22453/g.69121 Transcript_22453/m.69121 type:complete len:345 (-) Transcript_22453:13-1047(-)